MIQNRKETAWKKNRKFGDIHGGRNSPRFTDGIVKREHNLLRPSADQETPIFIEDHASRDFYFPVTIEEIKETLALLPTAHTEFLTHIWLGKVKKKDYLHGDTIQGKFVCGSGVYLIKLYAFPKNNKMLFGAKKPTNKQLSFYKGYCEDLRHDKNLWFLKWETQQVKRYYLEKLLLHEVGHGVDLMYHRYWSKANTKKVEDFADNYALIWSNHLREVYES